MHIIDSYGLTAIARKVSGGVGRVEFSAAFEGLRDRVGDSDNILNNIRTLKILCSDSYEYSNRNRNLLVVTAGVSVIMSYLAADETAAVVKECMELLLIVCKSMGERVNDPYIYIYIYQMVSYFFIHFSSCVQFRTWIALSLVAARSSQKFSDIILRTRVTILRIFFTLDLS